MMLYIYIQYIGILDFHELPPHVFEDFALLLIYSYICCMRILYPCDTKTAYLQLWKLYFYSWIHHNFLLLLT